MPLITIRGGQKAGIGDPLYSYSFNVVLQPGGTIERGDSFTILSLIGVTPSGFPTANASGSATMEPSTAWTSAVASPAITVLPYASNVTWTFAGNTPISAVSRPIDLGVFTVDTTVDFPNSPPYTIGALVYYSHNINGQTNSGFGSFVMSVPEPSSLIMLTTAAGTLLLVGASIRRALRAKLSVRG
jgi:hypothetical protein